MFYYFLTQQFHVCMFLFLSNLFQFCLNFCDVLILVSYLPLHYILPLSSHYLFLYFCSIDGSNIFIQFYRFIEKFLNKISMYSLYSECKGFLGNIGLCICNQLRCGHKELGQVLNPTTHVLTRSHVRHTGKIHLTCGGRNGSHGNTSQRT